MIMNYIYNKLRYLLFLVVLVLLIPAAPISGTVSGAAGRYTVYEQAPPPAEKIDPAVGEALAGKDYVEVLVKLTRQVDTGLVARDALRHAPSGEGGRAAVRAAVVDELRANADACQKSLMLYLEQERRQGQRPGIPRLLHSQHGLCQGRSRRGETAGPARRREADPAQLRNSDGTARDC
jgi:hypothetical protein